MIDPDTQTLAHLALQWEADTHPAARALIARHPLLHQAWPDDETRRLILHMMVPAAAKVNDIIDAGDFSDLYVLTGVDWYAAFGRRDNFLPDAKHLALVDARDELLKLAGKLLGLSKAASR